MANHTDKSIGPANRWEFLGDNFKPYRRHEDGCPLTSAKSDINACNCPVWMDGYDLHGKRQRKSLHTRSASVGMERMRTFARAQWVLAGEEGPVDPVIVLEVARSQEQRLRRVEHELDRARLITQLREGGLVLPANPLGMEHGASTQPAGDQPQAADAQQQAVDNSDVGNPAAERAARRQAVVIPILKKKRWKRGRLATEAAVAKNSVYEYLDGKRARISDENRKALAEALGLMPENLPI
jgi:hypothetical protein